MKEEFLKACKIIFLLFVTYFVVQYFIKNIDSLKELDLTLNWGIFAISMLFYFVYKYTLASLWHYITKIVDCSIQYSKAITAYLYSILGKYIPGKVFMLAARLVYYKEDNQSLGKVTVCFFIENICTLLGAALLFIFSLLFFPNDILADYKSVTYALIILFFICIHPKILNLFFGIIETILKKDNLKISLKYKDMLKIVLLFVLNWLIVGAGFYILVYSLYPLPISEALYTSGVFALAAIIGILSVFAPSGIGVREGIIVLGLSFVMPNEYAVIISIISRLWATIPELIMILFAFLYAKFKRKPVNVKEIEELDQTKSQ